MTHYPNIYAYMKKYSKANAIEGVRAVKDGSVLSLDCVGLRYYAGLSGVARVLR